MNLYKKLLKDIIAFCFGSMGSKILTFLLVPFYTYYLTTEEYGNIDFVTVTIQLALPVITLSVSNAVLRFCLDIDKEKREVLKYGLIIVTRGLVVFLLFLPVISYFSLFNGYEIYFAGILFFQVFIEVFGQYTKGCGKTFLFAFMGTLQTGLMFVLNILYIAVFQMGIKGYYISIVLSHAVICLIYIFMNLNDLLCLKKVVVLKKTRIDILNYSLPLIPNSLMWWIMNAIDRYFIIYLMGLASNGLYAVANKIPTILNTLFTIFNQAWQISVMDNMNKEEKTRYYQNIWEVFSLFMTFSTFILLVFSKQISVFLYSEEFYQAWQYTPTLLLSMYFSINAAFWGTFYLASNKTSSIMQTSIIGALINVILNTILIPIWGVQGAGIATALSYLGVMIFRIVRHQDVIQINISIIKFVLDIVLLAVTAGCVVNMINIILVYIIVCMILFIIHRHDLKKVRKTMKEKIIIKLLSRR